MTEIEQIKARLASGDERMTHLEEALAENTAATQQIADNTAGLVGFINDITAGAQFMCRVALGVQRMAKGIQWCVDKIIKPLWVPSLITFVVVYGVIYHTVPDWLIRFIKDTLP